MTGKAWIGAVAIATWVAAPAAGQWTEDPGRGWIDATVYVVDTRDQFEFNGDLRQFFANGHAKSQAVFVTAAAGIAPGFDAWVQLPFNRLEYNDAAGDRLRSGMGDTKLYLRAQPLRFLTGSTFPFAIRGGVKVSVGDFNVDSEIIPLGDGQTDWELMAEIGHSFYPLPLYANGWFGYRWRQVNSVARRDWGDEIFFLAQVGGNSGPIGFQLIFEGLESVTTPIIEGVALDNSRRQLVQLTPRVAYDLGPGAASVGARFSLAGKNLPAGTALVLGYFVRWPFAG